MAPQKSECPAATGQNANRNLLNAFKHNAKVMPLARFEQRERMLAALQQRPHHGAELRKLGVKNPARYAGDLVLMGHTIDSVPTCITTDTGAIISTVVYSLGVHHAQP